MKDMLPAPLACMCRCYKCPSNGLIVLFMALMMLLFILLNTRVTRQIETFLVLVNFCQVGLSLTGRALRHSCTLVMP